MHSMDLHDDERAQEIIAVVSISQTFYYPVSNKK